MKTRNHYLNTLITKNRGYHLRPKKEKSKILKEFCRMTGQHRTAVSKKIRSGKEDVPVIYKVHVTCKNPLPAPEVKIGDVLEIAMAQAAKEDSKNTDTKSRGKGKKGAQAADQTSEENTPESTPTLAIAKLICPACHIEIPTN